MKTKAQTHPHPQPAHASPLARVQSIGRAFSILEAISAHPDGIGLAELSKSVGLHNSTAFHLVKTMLDLGYVRQEPDNKRYFIGHRLFGLAAGANNEANMVFVAGPILLSGLFWLWGTRYLDRDTELAPTRMAKL